MNRITLTEWQELTTRKILDYLRYKLENTVFRHDCEPAESILELQRDILARAVPYTKFAQGPCDFLSAAGALVIAVKLVLGFDYIGENEEAYLPNVVALELGGNLDITTAWVKRRESDILKASLFNFDFPRRGRPRAAKGQSGIRTKINT